MENILKKYQKDLAYIMIILALYLFFVLHIDYIVEQEQIYCNPTQGTVTIHRSDDESECWEGCIYINKDGDKTRITVYDAIESEWDELF